MKRTFAEDLRIVWAITSKDLIDALKNKNVISLIITCVLVVIMYRYLPALTAEDGPPALLVYDEDESEFAKVLWDSPAVDLYTYDSEEDMKYYLTNGEVPELGLVIPADFDAMVEDGNPPVLQGYALQLFDDAKILELKRTMEDEFSYLLGAPISISVERIQLQPETGGMTVMPSMGFVFVSLMVGMMVIPHMMIEERQEKTIDALMISPASAAHIIAAKALTGMIYTLIVLFIALAFNWSLIQHAWLFLLAGMLGALFSISLGILLGLGIETRQQLILWAWVALIPLLLPVMLSLMDDLFPNWLILIFKWIPTSALFRAFRTSMVAAFSAEYYAPQLVCLVVGAALFFLVDIWLIRRLDR
jgi:ABC-2 type transport system permease protein